MHHKAISRRIYPNEQLKSVFEKHFGAVRYVFNHRIAELKEADQNKLRFCKGTSLTRLKKTEEFEWMNGLVTKSIQNAENDFDLLAYKVFMSRKNKKPIKYHFRSKKNFNSFRMSSQEYKVLDSNIIWLRPKIFGDFTHFELKNFVFPHDCKFYSITISKNNLNHYYLSITYEEEKTFKSKTNQDVAIDVGLSTLLVTSDNEFISNPKWLRENQLKLTALQKKFSKKKKLSSRWHKYKYKVAKLHHEISNTRKQFYHEITNDLFNRYDTIYVETLSITAMKTGNKSRNKSIYDSGLGILLNQLRYKSDFYENKEVIQVSKWFASTKICSSCKCKQKMKEQDRTYECSNCGISIDRDYNASLNILEEGRRIKFAA